MSVKKNLLLILAISILPPTGFLIAQDLFHTHDGLVHLPRIAAYFQALKDLQIPIRWVGDLNYGYGMPLFNFIYQLPYFFSSIFIFLGFSLVNAFKTVIAISFLFSGIFMFLFAKEFFKDNKKAFLTTIFYQFAPFRLVELLIRGSFGEVYAYTFLPLVLFGLIRHNFALTSFATALLVLSHNSVSLLFFGVTLVFVMVFIERKFLARALSSLVVGLALSAFYWLPALLERKFTYGDLFMKNLYLEHFAPLQNFFLPNFFNSKELQVGGVSVQIGLFHVVAIILSIILIKNKQSLRSSELKKVDKKTQKLIIFCLLVTVIALFFTQPVSKIFWENISLLRQFQFPWRFLGVIVFASSLLSASYLSFKLFKGRIFYFLLITATIISTVYYWLPQLGIDKISEDYYWNFPLDTTYYGETNVIWSAGNATSYPKERVQVVGEGNVLNFYKKSNVQTFIVDAKKDVLVIDHTQYFPGWKVYVDGKLTPVQFQDPSWRGLITFNVPQGMHQVKVSFGETKIRILADIISLVALVFILSLWQKKNYY